MKNIVRFLVVVLATCAWAQVYESTNGLLLAADGAVVTSPQKQAGAYINSRGLTINPDGSLYTSGGGGAVSGAAPKMGFYLAPDCPASGSTYCFQTYADTQVIQQCSFSNANTNVVCASGTFTSADVGKFAWGFDNCGPFLSQPRPAPIITTTHVTITAFVSSTTVTLSAGPPSGTTSTGCFIFGHPDDTAASALDTAIQSLATAPVCPKVFLSGAQYMFTTPHFFTQPPACSATPALYPPQSQGNIFYYSGFELEGRGPGNTIIWIPPDFPESGSCTNGVTGDACFAVPVEAKFSGFQISCGAGNCTIPSAKALISVDVGQLSDFTCTGVGDSTTVNRIGIKLTHWAQLNSVMVSSCGDQGIFVGNGARAMGFRVSSEVANGINANSANLFMQNSAARFTCYDCQFFGNQSNQALANIVQNGGDLYLIRPTILPQAGTAQFGYQCLTTGCVLTIDGGRIDTTASTNGTGIYCSANCTVKLINTTITATGTGKPINLNTTTGHILMLEAGNTFSGGAASANSGFTMNADAEGMVGITAAKAVLSGTWGSTAAWTSLNGGNSFTGTITASGTGQGASPTITYTFPSPLPVGVPFCRAEQVGGTQANGTFTASSVSATGATFTYSGTPVAGNTVFVQVFCE